MELCNRYDLRGPNCLYVTGIDDSYTVNKITDVFKVDGDIAKTVNVRGLEVQAGR
jgi:hypothetical protein